MPQLPRVTVITPCLNSAEFLQETIENVLAQDYPELEYVVMDGGSTDRTLEILKGFEGRLKYVSQTDSGTADAINKGAHLATGSILAWLSADDLYSPGAVRAAVEGFLRHPDAAVVYGDANWIDEAGNIIGKYPTVHPYSPDMFRQECTICQPACFFRRDVFEAVGGLDTRLQSAYDYDLWIRIASKYRFVGIRRHLAASRMHSRNKSLGQKSVMFQEAIGLLQRHYRYVPLQWVYGYACFQRDRRDQFFEPLQHSPATYLKALLIGTRYNPDFRLHFWREWLTGLVPGKLVNGAHK